MFVCVLLQLQRQKKCCDLFMKKREKREEEENIENENEEGNVRERKNDQRCSSCAFFFMCFVCFVYATEYFVCVNFFGDFILYNTRS